MFSFLNPTYFLFFTSLTSALPATPSPTSSASSSPTAPIIDLGYACYQGTHNSTFAINAYFGLHYAAAPTGDLRFRAPIPIESSFPSTPNNSSNTSAPPLLDATQWGPECIQITPAWSTPLLYPQHGSEDCLLLDILVPANPTSEKLPVWVQFHGGGFDQGYAERYPGWALVNQSGGGLIYVSVQYRLGAFGWLGGEEVRGDGGGNVGLLDMRAALEWVGWNIGGFGGDKEMVTVSGNSAGGGGVVGLLVMDWGGEEVDGENDGDSDVKVPFARAIAEYPWLQPYHDDGILEVQYQLLLSAANCTSNSTSNPGLPCLRSLSSDALNIAAQRATVLAYTSTPPLYGYGDYFWGPSIDGSTIPSLPSHLLSRGHFARVPLLIDHDAYEGEIFSNVSETTFSEETLDLQTLFPAADPSFFTRLWELYPAPGPNGSGEFNSTFWQRQAIFGDALVDCPTRNLAGAWVERGVDVWKMRFAAGTGVHGANVPFLFRTGDEVGNETLGEIVKAWYLGFVMDGDVNAGVGMAVERPIWDRHGKGEGGLEFGVMEVNASQMGMVGDADVGARCEFWREHSEVVRN